eukprot:TRINITY_DN37777_c0_g1_i1.p1 TRINITY_DN37777_c0_g1~~TRINITY_DN37777_c0_g1_i1.p1  ORF type:complete len:104 (-),score=6.70 TRINITY_DN37777_c0_g1_i1:311-592(-)
MQFAFIFIFFFFFILSLRIFKHADELYFVLASMDIFGIMQQEELQNDFTHVVRVHSREIEFMRVNFGLISFLTSQLTRSPFFYLVQLLVLQIQ